MSYPIQDGENIPEWLAKFVYRGYVNKYGNQQSYERIKERGGFGRAEVIWLLRYGIKMGIDEIEQALKEPKLCICCEEITEENAHIHRNCGK